MLTRWVGFQCFSRLTKRSMHRKHKKKCYFVFFWLNWVNWDWIRWIRVELSEFVFNMYAVCVCILFRPMTHKIPCNTVHFLKDSQLTHEAYISWFGQNWTGSAQFISVFYDMFHLNKHHFKTNVKGDYVHEYDKLTCYNTWWYQIMSITR